MRNSIHSSVSSVLLIRKVHATISRSVDLSESKREAFCFLALSGTFSSHFPASRHKKVTITVNCIFHPGRAFHTQEGNEMKANRERITMKHHVGKNEPRKGDEDGRRTSGAEKNVSENPKRLRERNKTTDFQHKDKV
jgi:hypothetical protein